MPALFIICPDCHLEEKIRNEHPDCFFVDALGGAVYAHSLDIKASIEHLFHTADITEIFIAIRDSCRLVDHDFSKNTADSESIQLSKYPLHLAKVESHLLQKIRQLHELYKHDATALFHTVSVAGLVFRESLGAFHRVQELKN